MAYFLQGMQGLIVAQSLGEKPITDLTEGPLHEVEPTQNAVWGTKNLSLDSPWTWGKTK